MARNPSPNQRTITVLKNGGVLMPPRPYQRFTRYERLAVRFVTRHKENRPQNLCL